jgi:hypothetical protein
MRRAAQKQAIAARGLDMGQWGALLWRYSAHRETARQKQGPVIPIHMVMPAHQNGNTLPRRIKYPIFGILTQLRKEKVKSSLCLIMHHGLNVRRTHP